MQKRYFQFCLFILLVLCTTIGCSSGGSSQQAIKLDKSEVVTSLRAMLLNQNAVPNVTMQRLKPSSYEVSLSQTKKDTSSKQKANSNSKLLALKNILKNVLNKKNLKPALRKELPPDVICLCQLTGVTLEGLLEYMNPDEEFFCICSDEDSCGCDWAQISWYALYFSNMLIEEPYIRDDYELALDTLSNSYLLLKETIEDYPPDSSACKVLSQIVQVFAQNLKPTEKGTVTSVNSSSLEDSMAALETIYSEIECPCKITPTDTNTDTHVDLPTAEISRNATNIGWSIGFKDLNNESWTLRIPENSVKFVSPTEALINGYVLESNVEFAFHMLREAAAENYEWLIDDIETVDSDKYVIEGTIVDSQTSSYVPNAIITINGQEEHTDIFGRFIIRLPKGEYQATITASGYESQTINVVVPIE